MGYSVADRSDAGFVVSDTDFYGNIMRARAFYWREQVRHLRDPYDRRKWTLTPQTATSGYTRESNAMEAPASLLGERSSTAPPTPPSTTAPSA